MSLDVNQIRSQFPSLQKKVNGSPIIYLDGPGGTQVPQSVIDRITEYYKSSNANTHGFFATSQETDGIMAEARQKCAMLLNAKTPDTISFGQNMTSLTFSLSHAIGRYLQDGDEMLITQLDHEANRGPWMSLKQYGVKVREVKMLETGELDYDDFEGKISENVKLVAVGGASNALGTVNDLSWVRKKCDQVGARLFVDAVHLAPHFLIDVQELGVDFMACSAYKFYGPHVGILYSRPGILDHLEPDRLRTADQHAPYRIETGTLNHAAIAGVSGAIDFIASWGQGGSLREKLESAYQQLAKHEFLVATKLYNGIADLKSTRIIGLPMQEGTRTPTISFFHDKISAAAICEHLGRRGICAWDGHFYAIRAIEVLGLLDKGGVTRLGISAYNTEEDIECTINALKELSTGG